MVLQPHRPDDLVTCPFDDSHRILRSRMQYHIVRCFKNHQSVTKIRCPWNSLHFVERCEYLDHCDNKCEDLQNVMGSTITMDEVFGGDVASIPVSSVINAPVPETTDDWDAAPCVGTYDPLKRSLDRPILRSSVGLSKAKKKAFRLEERRRHQRLEAELPIEIKTAGKLAAKPDVPKPFRRPHNLSLAMSADASMLDESKCYEDSSDGEKSGNLSGNLRPPHGPSPGLLLKANGNNESVEKTLFDRQLEDGSKADPEFFVSTTRSRSGKKMERKSIDALSPKTAKFPSAVVNAEKLEKPKDETIEVEEIFLQDGAACLPGKITNPTETDDEVAKLTEQLANVETEQKLLDQQRAGLLQKISKNAIKNRINGNFQDNKGNFSHNCSQQNGFAGTNRKCAATFGSPKKHQIPLKLGFGRGGIPFDFEALEKWKPIGIRENQQDSAKTDSPDVKKDGPKD